MFRSKDEVDDAVQSIQKVDHTSIILSRAVCVVLSPVSCCQLVLGNDAARLVRLCVWPVAKNK